MKIGLIDVDGHHYPNLALMHISAYHKLRGDEVDWWNALDRYDRVYMSKVFTWTPDIDTVIMADDIRRGGTGYGIYDALPDEIEHCFPDYSIYPYATAAYGFITRGCIRKCPWCVVPEKEGEIRPNERWQDIKRPDSRDMILMDNNVLALSYGIEQIEEMSHADVRIDFNQALDARLVTPEIAKMLARCKWITQIRFACDVPQMLPVVDNVVGMLTRLGMNSRRIMIYAMATEIEEAEKRHIALQKMGVEIYMPPFRPFDGSEPSAEMKRFARWANRRAIWSKCSYEEYMYKT